MLSRVAKKNFISPLAAVDDLPIDAAAAKALQERCRALDAQVLHLHREKEEIEKTLQDYFLTMNGLANQVRTLRKDASVYVVELEACKKRLESEIQKNDALSSECSVLRVKENAMDGSIASLQKELLAMQKKYEILRVHAEEKLSTANSEVSKMKGSFEEEARKLQEHIARLQVKLRSLEQLISMKTRENQELVKICDDLLGKIE